MFLPITLVLANWRLIDGTQSPSGHYAVAWSLPGRQVADLSPGDVEPNEVQNVLVDVRANRVLFRIPGRLPFFHQNHLDTDVTYTRDESLAVIIRSQKWFVDRATLLDTETGRTKEIWDGLRKAMVAYVGRHHAGYRVSELSELTYAVSKVDIKNTRMVIEAFAAIPKDEREVAMNCSYTIGGNKQGIVLHFEGIRPGKSAQ